MKHRPPPPDASPEDKLIIRLRQLVIDWRLAASGVNDASSPSIYVDCADELEKRLDDHERGAL